MTHYRYKIQLSINSTEKLIVHIVESNIQFYRTFPINNNKI